MTDGTAAGTRELTEVSLFSLDGVFSPDLTVFDGEALFEGNYASGSQGLWVTDGTAAGTHELSGIANANAGGLSPSDLTVLAGEVLFAGDDASGQTGLWATDGTAAGTHELSGIAGASSSLPGLDPSDLTVFDGEVLFAGNDASGSRGLWVTDGTAAGTHELTGIAGASSYGFALTVLDGEVLFAGFNASGSEGLWVTNGTAAGTHELTGIAGASSSGVLGLFSGNTPPDLTVFNGEVLFAGFNASGSEGLWVTDGTAAGTHELTGIADANAGGVLSGIYAPDLTVFNSEVLFEGKDASGQTGLWVSYGTAADTHELTGLSWPWDEDILAFEAPTVAITNVGGLPDSANLTLTGTIDAADAGLTISIDDGAAVLATTTADGAGAWTAAVTLSGNGPRALTARATDKAGFVGVSNAEYLATAGGETIDFADGSGDAASLYDTGGDKDIVDGSGGWVYLTSARAQVLGGGDTIDFAGGSGNFARLLNTDGDRDKVIGSGGKVKLVDSRARVIGDDDIIHLLGASGDDVVKLAATGAGPDTVYGSDAKVVLLSAEASLTGNDDAVHLHGDNTLTANGAAEAFVFAPTIGLNTIDGFAATDSMQFNVADFANFAALSGHISQSGANTVITLDASDAITLKGVTATSLNASQFQFV